MGILRTSRPVVAATVLVASTVGWGLPADAAPPSVSIVPVGQPCSATPAASVDAFGTLAVILRSDEGATLEYRLYPSGSTPGPWRAYTLPLGIAQTGEVVVEARATNGDGEVSTASETFLIDPYFDLLLAPPTDDFEREDGPVGPPWTDAPTTEWKVKDGQLLNKAGGSLMHRAEEPLGVDQAAAVMIGNHSDEDQRGLLLKVQAGDDGTPDVHAGAIAVMYQRISASTIPGTGVIVSTRMPGATAFTADRDEVAFGTGDLQVGDTLGARVGADGVVHVFAGCKEANPVHLDPKPAAFFASVGGAAGLRRKDPDPSTPESFLFDDFRAATVG